jgi:hypothetical protein
MAIHLHEVLTSVVTTLGLNLAFHGREIRAIFADRWRELGSRVRVFPRETEVMLVGRIRPSQAGHHTGRTLLRWRPMHFDGVSSLAGSASALSQCRSRYDPRAAL